MRTILAGLLLAGAIAGAAAQDDVPDFTGTWSGTFDVIVLPRDGNGEGEVVQAAVTFELTKQSGRLLWGTVSSDKTETRPVALAFSLNNGTLLGSDSIGFHRLTVISANRMEACFSDNGSGSIIASCGVIRREE
jgi:hypothetical protein